MEPVGPHLQWESLQPPQHAGFQFYVCACVCVSVCMCVCTWGSEVDVECFLQLLSALFILDKGHSLTLVLTDWAGLDGQ